jgi:hypothetical protein
MGGSVTRPLRRDTSAGPGATPGLACLTERARFGDTPETWRARQGERTRAGSCVDPSGVRTNHVQDWTCGERSGLGSAANLDRCSRASDSGESPTVDNDDRSDDESNNDTASAEEDTAEVRCAARCSSGTSTADVHQLAVDEPVQPTKPAERGIRSHSLWG